MPPPYRPPVTEPCAYCQRPFEAGRRQEHEAICARISQKRHPVFDAQKQRLRGTEHGPMFQQSQRRPPPAVKENRWRQRHEDFIAAVRAARQAQQHLAAGGRPQDLPPPPPSDYSDYIQCPHCSRRFNEAAAERHIPRCQFYEHNKPGPSAARGRAVPARGRAQPAPGSSRARGRAAPRKPG